MQKTYEIVACKGGNLFLSMDINHTFSDCEQSMPEKGLNCLIVRKHLYANRFENAKP
jgi:hypothetical protein